MLKLKSVMIFVLITLTLIQTQVSQAQTATSPELDACRTRVNRCEGILRADDIVIKKQSIIIDQLATEVNRLDEQLTSAQFKQALAESESNMWYRRPEVVAPIAAIIGALAVKVWSR